MKTWYSATPKSIEQSKMDAYLERLATMEPMTRAQRRRFVELQKEADRIDFERIEQELNGRELAANSGGEEAVECES